MRRLLTSKVFKRLPYTTLVIIALIFPLWILDWGPLDLPIAVPDMVKPLGRKHQEKDILEKTPDVLRGSPVNQLVQSFKISAGDTLMKIFTKAGLKPNHANSAIRSLSNLYDPRTIQVGQLIKFKFERLAFLKGNNLVTEKGKLEQIIIQPDLYREYIIRSIDRDNFVTTAHKKKIKIQIAWAEGQIDSSLYVSALKSGMPVSVLMEFIRIYSWDVDFQRSIRSGDKFQVLFERLLDENSNFVSYGKIIFTKLKLGKEEKFLYRFKNRKGYHYYFDPKGNSARKTLMRTPINGARLSSSFGRRMHPILGYTKMHQGVDFAAPRGTPILAAGSGTITYRGRNGAYGKFIRIRHNSVYSTAYAHLSKYRRSIRKGSRVRQGQIIGYVGTSGRSTGPHLHYEILRHGKRTNPMRVRMPSGKNLKGKRLAEFITKKDEINILITKTLNTNKKN